jgi:peptidoglycan biosynthesis protein MviN/MurJ (putative lipid II flippase)
MSGLSTGEIHHPTSALRSSATVAAWTLVSRVTGLGRVVVIGAVLGPTFLANSFVATNTVPNIVYLSIAGTVLSAVVVPAIVRTTAAAGICGAADMLGRLAGYLLMVSVAVSALLIVCSPTIARLLTFGIADAEIRGRAEQLVVPMLLVVTPQVMCYMMATIGAAAQQARGRFALASAAPAVENIGVIATVVAVGLIYGSGVEMDSAPLGLVVLLCAGSTLSVALHMGLQLVGAARVGLPIRPRFRLRSDLRTQEITRRLRQSSVVAASPMASYFVLIVLAGTVPGGALVVQMAYNVYSLPVALGGRAVSTAVLPGLSAAAGDRDRSAFNDKVREGVAYAVIAGLPPLILLSAFASPIADVLANGRLRVGGLIESLAGCLVVLAVAQLAAGLHEVGRQGLFARLDVRSPRIAALLAFGITLLAGLAALVGLAGTDRLIGLAVALLAGDIAAAATVILFLRREVRPEPLSDGRRLAAAALASTVMLPLVAAGLFLLALLHENRIVEFLIVALTSGLSLGLFGLTLGVAVRHSRGAR